MWNEHVEGFMGCDDPVEKAETVLFGAPFDSTTSYRPGARFASAAIRRESYGIESYSPYQDRDLLDAPIADLGDLELCFGDTQAALAQIKAGTQDILQKGKRPFLVGGEHLVTLGAFQAVWEQWPDVALIHFDAHADLRQDYLGNRLSHACVIRRIWELVGDGRIYQFGIRSGDKEEWQWSREHVSMTPFRLEGIETLLEYLPGRPVYFTVDLDVLDPAVFPGTGTPEPGGIAFEELRQAVTLVCSMANIVACDVNELSPHYDQSGISTITACKIIREMLLAL